MLRLVLASGVVDAAGVSALARTSNGLRAECERYFGARPHLLTLLRDAVDWYALAALEHGDFFPPERRAVALVAVALRRSIITLVCTLDASSDRKRAQELVDAGFDGLTNREAANVLMRLCVTFGRSRGSSFTCLCGNPLCGVLSLTWPRWHEAARAAASVLGLLNDLLLCDVLALCATENTAVACAYKFTEAAAIGITGAAVVLTNHVVDWLTAGKELQENTPRKRFLHTDCLNAVQLLHQLTANDNLDLTAFAAAAGVQWRAGEMENSRRVMIDGIKEEDPAVELAALIPPQMRRWTLAELEERWLRQKNWRHHGRPVLKPLRPSAAPSCRRA